MQYKALIKELKTRLDAMELYNKDDASRKAVLEAVWSVGRDVYRYTQETGEMIKTVAEDLGTPEGSLQKYVRFYKCYPKGYKESFDGKAVAWSHYACVIYVANKEAREFYLKESATQGWSSHELRRRIRNNFYESSLDAIAGKLANSSTRQLKTIKQKLYTYAAELLRVIDGDTLELNIDVGFNTWMKHKVRLRGINCPEKGTKKGDETKNFVENELQVNQLRVNESKANKPATGKPATGKLATGELVNSIVIIRTYKSGKFGRYIVDVWYLPGETDKERILEKGRLLNQVLLDNGLARKVE